MDTVEFIMEKREKKTHSTDDMFNFFSAYIQNEIPDYQVAAWLMAAFLNGLNTEEKICLTKAIINSGDKFDLSHIQKPKVDKHSTGGVGDKTSIVLLPLLASLDVCVPMMSGRGLGHTGGTLDKLEAIPGMTVNFPMNKYVEILEKTGAVFMAQTDSITPLDKKLYALRDVTATVESIPLITASIIGKKTVEDLDALVLDVKFGNGAFMKTIQSAKKLAESLVDTSSGLGVDTVALLTDMNEPLGEFVGNSVEIIEAINMLKGEKVEQRFYEVTLQLAKQMFISAFPEKKNDAENILKNNLSNGKAYEKFIEVISIQGVKNDIIDKLPGSLPLANKKIEIKANNSGFIADINSYKIGRLLVEQKAGRLKIDDKIDFGVGLQLLKHIGDKVNAGETLAILLVNQEAPIDLFANCFNIQNEKIEKPPVVVDIIGR